MLKECYSQIKVLQIWLALRNPHLRMDKKTAPELSGAKRASG